ncbi:DUF732 domain-containing protein [Stackebrandtia soli]|uniref:DUF732 domain-containing protein n=1 Tax=Stackebrandtia soli TaxID=1892856 RepID=UPI0039ED4B2E
MSEPTVPTPEPTETPAPASEATDPPTTGRTIGIVAAIILTGILCLAGIAASSDDPPTYPPTTQNAQTSALDLDAAYVATVRSLSGSEFNAVTDAALITLGHTICDALDRGVSVGDIMAQGVTSDVSAAAIGAATGSAVAAYCPEYQGLVDDYVSDHT